MQAARDADEARKALAAAEQRTVEAIELFGRCGFTDGAVVDAIRPINEPVPPHARTVRWPTAAEEERLQGLLRDAVASAKE